MSEDWKAGDLAVCVDVRPRGHEFDDDLRAFQINGTYRVSKVCHAGGLLFVGIACRGISGFWEDRFRKLNDEPDDIALIERIRKCKPAKVTANA